MESVIPNGFDGVRDIDSLDMGVSHKGVGNNVGHIVWNVEYLFLIEAAKEIDVIAVAEPYEAIGSFFEMALLIASKESNDIRERRLDGRGNLNKMAVEGKGILMNGGYARRNREGIKVWAESESLVIDRLDGGRQGDID